MCLLATRCWNHGHLDTMSAASTCRIYSQSLAWWLNGKCTNQLRTMSCCMSFFQTKRGRLPSDFNIMGMFFHTVWCSFMFFHVLSYTCIYIYTFIYVYCLTLLNLSFSWLNHYVFFSPPVQSLCFAGIRWIPCGSVIFRTRTAPLARLIAPNVEFRTSMSRLFHLPLSHLS